jgi:hypothetical protein
VLNSPRAWGISQRAWPPRTWPGIAQIAERKAREEAGERDGWGPGGYKWRQWDHLKEERRRTEIETEGRASVADLYE